MFESVIIFDFYAPPSFVAIYKNWSRQKWEIESRFKREAFWDLYNFMIFFQVKLYRNVILQLLFCISYFRIQDGQTCANIIKLFY
jgi:hypothetical protein